MVLPTSPQLKDGFGDLSAITPAALHTLLDPHIPQKLMYSLYLVASLCSGKEAKVTVAAAPRGLWLDSAPVTGIIGNDEQIEA